MSETRQTGKKRRISQIVLLLLVVALLIGLGRFIHHRLNYAVTNAVFVASDSLSEVGFERVGGTLLELPLKEGEAVKQGQLLARIDPEPYRLEVERLQAELSGAQKNHAALVLQRGRLETELQLQVAVASREVERLRHQRQAQQARCDSLQTQIDQLQRDRDRYRKLLEQQVIARHRLEQLETKLDSRNAELRTAQKQRDALQPAIKAALLQQQLARTRQAQLEELDQQLAAAAANVERLQAKLDKAQRDLANTELRSPLAGRIAKRLVTPGSQVAPGRPLYALVDPNDLYLNALLEENKLAGVQPGNRVEIDMDAYPDQHWRGEVEAILPASAATFALAPRDISAGEFTKVAQRIPLRIRITEGPMELLRVGLGGEVEIERSKS